MRKTLMMLAACVTMAMAGAQAAPLDQLAWLAGCWSADGGEPGSGEQWTVQGTVQGKAKRIDFPMTRAACPGQVQTR